MLRLLLTAAIPLWLSVSTQAADYHQGSLEITHPWTRPTPDLAKNGAAYLTIKNNGKEADMLTSVQTTVAERAQVHETIHDGDIMKMRPVTGGISVGPGETVTFAPGGYHIMLLGLKQKLEEGKQVPLTLTFAKAGQIKVEADVEKSGPSVSPSPADHMHMD